MSNLNRGILRKENSNVSLCDEFDVILEKMKNFVYYLKIKLTLKITLFVFKNDLKPINAIAILNRVPLRAKQWCDLSNN